MASTSTSQKTINNRIRAKRDILQVLSHTKDKLSRKDLTLAIGILQGRGGTGTLDYSYNVLVYALKELEKESKIVKQWAWGVAGNWEYRYTKAEDES